MRRIALLLALALLLLAAAPAAAERSETRRYFGGFEFFALNVGGVAFFGAQFQPRAGETQVNVSIADEFSGTGVLLFVCQDTNGDGECGNAQDRWAADCAPVALTGIDDTKEVAVWVGGAFSVALGCSGPGVRGTLTATFS